MKIHIVGGAGSGKSYIADQLSKKLRLPHYDLDDIFWENSVDTYGIKAPVEVREQKLSQIVSQDSWILEGVYISWLEPSFSVVDHIFVLMPPLDLQEQRIWSRFHARLSGTAPSKKKETIESVHELIKWNEMHNNNTIQNFILNSPYKKKIEIVEENTRILDFWKV